MQTHRKVPVGTKSRSRSPNRSPRHDPDRSPTPPSTGPDRSRPQSTVDPDGTRSGSGVVDPTGAEVRKTRSKPDSPTAVDRTDPDGTAPDRALPDPRRLDIATHLDGLRRGDTQSAREGLSGVRYGDTLTEHEQSKALGHWIDTVLGDPTACAAAVTDPEFFSELVEAAQELVSQRTSSYSADRLIELLSALAPDAAARVATFFLEENWHRAEIVPAYLCQWISSAVTVTALNARPDGPGPKLALLLWNAGNYTMICDLIKNGLDTSHHTYVTDPTVTGCEGVIGSYIVMPIQHVLGNYVHLTALKDLTGTTGPDGRQLTGELIALAVKTKANRGRPEVEQRALGAQKVEGAREILATLKGRQGTAILTDFESIRNCQMLNDFRGQKTKGTIWGFEYVRLPYVHAAHMEPGGNQVLRMWEMWDAVDQVLQKPDMYANLVTRTDTTIGQIMPIALAAARENYAARPVEYSFWRLTDFEKAFTAQCEEYLRFLATQVPHAKWATTLPDGSGTADIRGLHRSSYMGAMACNVGLWWSLKKDQKVYYCLDGVDDTDIVQYKTRKTARINAFLDRTDTRYIEVITLAEIHEILTNWTDLSKVVRFYKQGKPLDAEAVERLVADTLEADRKIAGTRKVPADNEPFRKVLHDLDPDLPLVVDDRDRMRVVAQFKLFELAARATGPEALVEFFSGTDSRILYHNGVLPSRVGRAFREMVAEKDPRTRRSLARNLLIYVLDNGYDGIPRVESAQVLALLEKAITWHGGLDGTT